MEFDQVLERVGGFGRYQKLHCFILCLASALVSSYCHYALIIMLFTPPFWCEMDEGLVTGTEACDLEDSARDNCSWGFNYSEVGSTAVSSFHLVCDRRWFVHISFTLYTIGDMLGVILVQTLVDVFGRKKMFMMALMLHLIGGSLAVMIPNLYVFLVCKFLDSVGGVLSFISLFVWGAEIITPNKRALFSNATQAAFSLGTASLGVIGYLLKDWVIFGLTTTVPSLLFFFALLLSLPESPRWLLASQKPKEEIMVGVQKIAKMNGVEGLNEQSIESLVHDCIQEQLVQPKRRVKFWVLLMHKNMRWKVLVITILYICTNLAYYTSQFNSENLPGNPFLVFALAGLVEIPGTVLNVITVDRYGRIRTTAVFMAIGGLTAIACAFVPLDKEVLNQGGNHWPIVILALVSKVFFAASYITTMQLCSEHFPTVVRGAGMGMCALVSRFTFVLMPMIRYTAELYTVMPLIILGSLSLFSAVICLLLPETMGKNLPETFADAVIIGSVGLESFCRNLGFRVSGFGRKESQARNLVHSPSGATGVISADFESAL